MEIATRRGANKRKGEARAGNQHRIHPFQIAKPTIHTGTLVVLNLIRGVKLFYTTITYYL